MEPWVIWLIISIILISLELLFSGFVLLCFGFAAIITSIITLSGVRIEVQIFSFIIFTIIAFITVRPFFLKHMKPAGEISETNVFALIGKEAIVTSTIIKDGSGVLKIRGDEWTALSENNSTIEAGNKVIILKIDGNKLIVKNIKQGE